MLKLTNQDRAVVIAVLKRSFPSANHVNNFLVSSDVSPSVRGGINSNTRDNAVTTLYDESRAVGELPTLLVALHKAFVRRTDITQLVLTLSQREGWPPDVTVDEEYFENQKDLRELRESSEGLERLTNDADPFVDAKKVNTCTENALQRVCFIRRRSDKTQLGTGFLVGDNQVLTCYHVVKADVTTKTETTLRVSGLEAVFDYSTNSDSAEPDANTLPGISIDEAYDTPFAPYSAADAAIGSGQEPALDELDFALLRLTSSEGATRGYFLLDPQLDPPERHSPVIIAQHPGDPPPPARPKRLLPLKLSFAQPGIVGWSANETRIIYYNGTLPGSSGSPVFDRDGNVVALHHNRGDFADQSKTLTQNNRGIPIRAILRLLAQRHIELGDQRHIELGDQVPDEGQAAGKPTDQEAADPDVALIQSELPPPETASRADPPEDLDRVPRRGEIIDRWDAKTLRVYVPTKKWIVISSLLCTTLGFAIGMYIARRPPDTQSTAPEITYRAVVDGKEGPLNEQVNEFEQQFDLLTDPLAGGVTMVEIGPFKQQTKNVSYFIQPLVPGYKLKISGILLSPDGKSTAVRVSPSGVAQGLTVRAQSVSQGDAIRLLVGIQRPAAPQRPDSEKMANFLIVERKNE